MDILSDLSSQNGDKTEQSNNNVAKRCLKTPHLLQQIAECLNKHDPLLLGDCAEVMTFVAMVKPQLIKSYIDRLVPLLTHRTTKVRWESMHAIALIADLCPDEIAQLLPQLKSMSITDSSTIVRDYCTIAIGNYARTSKQAAREALVALELIREQWKDKQASRVFAGLEHVFHTEPRLKNEILSLVQPFEKSARASVKKAYKGLMKTLETNK